MAKKAAKEESAAKEASPAKKQSGITKPMKLSADLAAVVGQKQASRAECIKQLWAYLKKNNLQDPENKQYFTPDKKMAKIFGTEKIRGFGMLRSVDECNEDDDLAKSSPIEARESGNERETTRIDETLDDNRFRGKTGY